MPLDRREAERWLRYAREDLAAAVGSDENSSLVPRHVCYLAQQAVEKALKAALIMAGVNPPRIHVLDVLKNLLPADWSVRTEHPRLGALTFWSEEARYPTDEPDPSWEEAKRAAEQAGEVLRSIARDLRARGLEPE
jgi:HEPN domain-containing protein